MASAPAAPAPPPLPSLASLLPVIPAGQVPGAAEVLAQNRVKATAAAADAARRGAMGTHSERGGRKTRRRRRLMSRKYCKKTSCRRMGFTQKASCRPYKNCYRK